MTVKEKISIKWGEKAVLRDGVNVSCDIYGSEEGVRKPVIILRTPYGKSTENIVSTGKYFAERGFVFIASDVRGRGDSDGYFLPYAGEGQDGYDLIEWAAKQPWSNGNIGTIGGSYSGRIQWYAAILRPPSLKSMITVVSPSDPFVEDPTGVPSPLSISWDFFVSGRMVQNIEPVDWKSVYSHLPLRTMDSTTGREMKSWKLKIEHQVIDDYTRSISYQQSFEKVNVPVLNISGWYDDEQIGTPLNFSAMKKISDSRVSSQQALLMGPWGHGVNSESKFGEFDFGSDSIIDLLDYEKRWFDRTLNGNEDAFSLSKPVRLFLMGKNQWRNYENWPPENMVKQEIYLHSGGKANSRFGDGKLYSSSSGSKAEFDAFTYDPDNPVPFISESEFKQIGGADSYTSIERRDDVLVYTSDVFKQPLEVTGPVILRLFVSTTGSDTDFTGKLLVVLPDGRAVRLCDGITRLSRRNGSESVAKVQPEEMYEITVNMWNTSYEFAPGTRLRLEVSSSAFPKYARNMNKEGNQADFEKGIIAEQKVFHGKGMESRLEIYGSKTLGEVS